MHEAAASDTGESFGAQDARASLPYDAWPSGPAIAGYLEPRSSASRTASAMRFAVLGLDLPGPFPRASRPTGAWNARTRSICARAISVSLRDLKNLYVTVPAGAADLAAEELAAFGVTGDEGRRAAASRAPATLEQAYRACLWSRVANRVLLQIAEFRRADAGSALRRRARGRLERASRRGRHARGRLHEPPLRDHAHAIRRAQDEGCDRRPVPRATAARGRRSTSRRAGRAREPAPRPRRATLVIDLSRRKPAPARLPRPQGAAPLKENLAAADAVARGWHALIAEAAGRRAARLRRPDVRLGHARASKPR